MKSILKAKPHVPRVFGASISKIDLRDEVATTHVGKRDPTNLGKHLREANRKGFECRPVNCLQPQQQLSDIHGVALSETTERSIGSEYCWPVGRDVDCSRLEILNGSRKGGVRDADVACGC